MAAHRLMFDESLFDAQIFEESQQAPTPRRGSYKFRPTYRWEQEREEIERMRRERS